MARADCGLKKLRLNLASMFDKSQACTFLVLGRFPFMVGAEVCREYWSRAELSAGETRQEVLVAANMSKVPIIRCRGSSLWEESKYHSIRSHSFCHTSEHTAGGYFRNINVMLSPATLSERFQVSQTCSRD